MNMLIKLIPNPGDTLCGPRSVPVPFPDICPFSSQVWLLRGDLWERTGNDGFVHRLVERWMDDDTDTGDGSSSASFF